MTVVVRGADRGKEEGGLRELEPPAWMLFAFAYNNKKDGNKLHINYSDTCYLIENLINFRIRLLFGFLG